MSEAVYILGVYSTQFQRWPEKGFKDLTREAHTCASAEAER
jgi:hypothetical protein